MAAKPVPEKELKRTQRAYEQTRSITKAAAALGVSERTVRRRLAALPAERALEDEVALTPAADEDLSIDELVAFRRMVTQRKINAHRVNKLQAVKVKLDGPIAITHIGDPHIDDDGCDIAQLEHDLTTVGRTEGMFAGHIGDLTNNWIGRLARLYAHQSTTGKQAVKLAEWMLGLAPNLYVVAGNHDCHDMHTEALTRTGWKRGEDIQVGEEVFTMNVDTGAGEWNEVQAKVLRQHEGEMVEMRTQAISALVTPNHRILHRKRVNTAGAIQWRPDLEYAHAADLPSRFSIPTSAVENANGVSLTDDQIRFAGLVLTDGSIAWNKGSPKVSIWQSNDGQEIERVLAACGFEYTQCVRHREIKVVAGRELVKPPMPQREYRLSADMSRRALAIVPEKHVLPGWAWDMTAQQFDVFLDALIAGDGCWDGGKPEDKCVAVLHGRKPFLDHVQALACTRGWYARMSVARGKDYRLNLCRRAELQLNKTDAVRHTDYSGSVWCLTVKNSNFLVRRDGAAHFSGNCWGGTDLLSFILAQHREKLSPHGVRLALHFPNGREVRIHARHDFPGHSQYNNTHGHRKETLFGHRDHLLIAGHKHVDGAAVTPSVEGIAHWMFRVSGYKVVDSYADEHNFHENRLAPSVTTIIDPDARVEAELIKPYWDVEEAADILTYKRKRAGQK